MYPLEGEITTTAMAEGVIDGTADMYEMPDAHATDFKFSQFYKKPYFTRNDIHETAETFCRKK